MNAKPSNSERLSHLIEAINRIFKFVEDMDFAEFSTNEMAQFAIIKNFEIIGEAAFKLPKDFRENHEQIEWRKIIAFRHILVHEYYKINPEIVWNAIENKLMDLKIKIEIIQESQNRT